MAQKVTCRLAITGEQLDKMFDRAWELLNHPATLEEGVILYKTACGVADEWIKQAIDNLDNPNLTADEVKMIYGE